MVTFDMETRLNCYPLMKNFINIFFFQDCFFKNAKKVTFHEMTIPNHYLWLYHDKTLLYMSKYVEIFPSSIIMIIFYLLIFRLTLVLSCAMKFESYPHDEQVILSRLVKYLTVIFNFNFDIKVCSMMIESCKLTQKKIKNLLKVSNFIYSIAHSSRSRVYLEFK